jgi:hypothetical protein
MLSPESIHIGSEILHLIFNLHMPTNKPCPHCQSKRDCAGAKVKGKANLKFDNNFIGWGRRLTRVTSLCSEAARGNQSVAQRRPPQW